MGASDVVPNNWREWRRLRAVQLKHEGWYQRHIAEALGISEVTVSKWLARARDDGIESLLAHPGPGHPSGLSPAQRAMIPEFLWHGPEPYGFRGQVWNCARVAKVIELGIRSRLPQGACRSPAQGVAMDAPNADAEGHPAR